MTVTLAEQCAACRDALLAAILDALRERADYFASIERTARDSIPATGLALELFPWAGGFGLSLRLYSDYPGGNSRYDSADWPHYDFTEGCTSPSVLRARSLVEQIYARGSEPGGDRRDMAHLLFMAGAEALMHPEVARLLDAFGIEAETLADEFVSSPFQYIVTDVDETVKSNYCDIVLSNRVLHRLLGPRGPLPSTW